jgi:hypothetical protein
MNPRHRRLPGATEEGGAMEVAFDAYELLEQMRMAGCGDDERRAVVLWLRHRSGRRVAAEMGLPRAKVMALLRTVATTIAAWREQRRRGTTHADILGVYASEISRHAPVGEHHCLPGEEECVKTGLCTRRWYLFREPMV